MTATAASTLEEILIDIVLGKKLTAQLDWLDAEPKDYIRYLRRKLEQWMPNRCAFGKFS
jgi:hypothetical protein